MGCSTRTRALLLRFIRSKVLILAVLIGGSYLFSSYSVTARPRPSGPAKIPNGGGFECASCHIGTNYALDTQFKLDFYALGTNHVKTWTLGLASTDSDSDGFTNGEELQDFAGTWIEGQAEPGNSFYVSNPSASNSYPVAPIVSGIGNFFGSVAYGSVSFWVFIDFAALPIDYVKYTIKDSQNNTVFTSTATNSAPPFTYLSEQWNTLDVPNGSYTITAEVVEKRQKGGVTPRRGIRTESFDVLNAEVTLSAGSYTVNEGATTATITIEGTNPHAQSFSVEYATSNGTALAGSDYSAISGTLDFDYDYQQTFTIVVPISDDALDEPNESVTFTLRNPNGVRLNNPSSATITIVDDDAPPLVSFSTSALTTNESAGFANVAVQLSAPSSKIVTVAYATSNGSASAGEDYTAKNGTLTFALGQTSQAIAVPILDDTLDEPDETLQLALTAPVNTLLGSPAVATLTIVDDDVVANRPLVTLAAADTNVAEAGAESATITIARSGDTTAALTIRYTIGGSATAGGDYAVLSGSVDILAGQSSATIVIVATDDTAIEGDETIIVTLSTDAGYSLGTPNSATVTIADDEHAPAPGPVLDQIITLPILLH